MKINKKEKRFKIFTDVQTNEETIVDMVKGEPLTINEICDKLNKLIEPIKEECTDEKEYKECSECGNFETDYEEVIVFGDYQTLTKDYCNAGHDVDDVDANNCPDYF